MDNHYGLYAIIFVAIVVVIFLYVHFKEKANLKKAETGEDKARFQEAVRKVMGEGNYTMAYAHWEDVQHYGRTTKTTYYHYALAFDETNLWIMPLRFERELILPDKPALATKEMLGIVNVDSRMSKKNNLADHVAVTLHDKDGKKLVDLTVDSVNTKEDRFHHVNLLQVEECDQFERFISAMAGTVREENAELPGRLKEEANAKRAKSAQIMAIIGIVGGVIFSIIGLVLGIAALINAPKPKDNGGKVGLPLILSIVCLAVTVLFLCLGSPVTTWIFSLFAA